MTTLCRFILKVTSIPKKTLGTSLLFLWKSELCNKQGFGKFLFVYLENQKEVFKFLDRYLFYEHWDPQPLFSIFKYFWVTLWVFISVFLFFYFEINCALSWKNVKNWIFYFGVLKIEWRNFKIEKTETRFCCSDVEDSNVVNINLIRNLNIDLNVIFKAIYIWVNSLFYELLPIRWKYCQHEHNSQSVITCSEILFGRGKFTPTWQHTI